MRALTFVLVLALLAVTTGVRGGEFAVEEVPGHGLGGSLVYVGATASDLGGDSRPGLALALFGKRRPVVSGFCYRLGLEFSDKRNVGTVSQSSSADGSLIYRGQGTVSLKYLQVVGELQFVGGLGSVTVVPYVGLAPAILINQEVSADAEDVSLGDLDWYSDFDMFGLVGVELGYRRLRLDLQYAEGLGDLEASRDRAEGDWPPAPQFEPTNGRSRSFRVAAGVMF